MKHITYRQLLEALKTLTEQQMDMSVTVSGGCGVNGNAEFYPVVALTMAMCPDIEASASGVLEDTQPIIIYEDGIMDF